MCGIAGIYLHDAGLDEYTASELATLSRCLLLEIEHRGQDATGIAKLTLKKRAVVVRKAAMSAEEFIEAGNLPRFENMRSVMLHTRFATQGSPKVNGNNHPVQRNDTSIVHNGHITNDDKILTKGRKAKVDSEAIAAVLSKMPWSQPKVVKQLGKLQGGMATVAMRKGEDVVVLAKGQSSPVVVAELPGMIIWASTARAVELAVLTALGIPVEAGYMREGDVFFLHPEGVEEATFKVKKSKWVGYSHNTVMAWEHDEEDDEEKDDPTYRYRTILEENDGGVIVDFPGLNEALDREEIEAFGLETVIVCPGCDEDVALKDTDDWGTDLLCLDCIQDLKVVGRLPSEGIIE